MGKLNLKVLFIILLYYTILSAVFIAGASEFGGYSSNIALNDSDLTSSEIDQGGLFGTGVSFGRFFTLVSFGIGLPSDTPSWFAFLFGAWQTLVTIFTVGFVISSIWNG